jgi:glutathione S-transferase
MSLLYANQSVELREILLQDKPQSMLEASPKGTVPVMVLPEGTVLEESLDVMHWALTRHDPDGWWTEGIAEQTNQLVEQNDLVFKPQLDRYKYWERFPPHSRQDYRLKAEGFLALLEQKLQESRYLISHQMSFADVAIFPFIRQFAFVDHDWFKQSPYPNLQRWLEHLLETHLFKQTMAKTPAWQHGDNPIVLQELKAA